MPRSSFNEKLKIAAEMHRLKRINTPAASEMAYTFCKSPLEDETTFEIIKNNIESELGNSSIQEGTLINNSAETHKPGLSFFDPGGSVPVEPGVGLQRR